MTFISYAQNGEDVVLWRALKHVENGFYIDVGACDPDDLSVTKAFYERGWHGINIEPVREYYELCVKKRPRDKNINVAVTARSGLSRFMTVKGTGLSTTVNQFATEAANRGWDVEAQEVLSLSLADICTSLSIRDVHFLKIDVEGAERAVLEGADFEQVRPWIVLVEATEPLSTERSEHLWEHILLQAGYQRSFFDGVNLYYVAQEHSELIETLAAPPNALDEYKPVRMAEAEERITHLAAELELKNQELEEQHRRLGAEHHQQDELKKLLEDLRLQYTNLQVVVADQAQTHELEVARLAETHRLEIARQAEAHALELAGHIKAHEVDLADRDRLISDLRAQNAHQTSSAIQRLEFTTRKLAQSRREILELEERLHAQQHSLDSVAGLIGLDPLTIGPSVNVASALKVRLEDQVKKIDELTNNYKQLAAEQAIVRKHRDDLLLSTSWRVSAPLRKTKTALRIVRSQPHLVLPLVIENLRRLGTRAPGLTAIESGGPDLPMVHRQDDAMTRLERDPPRHITRETYIDRHDAIVASIRYGISRRRHLSQQAGADNIDKLHFGTKS